MNAPASILRSWSLTRWFLLIALTFAAHIGFIFAFSARKPIEPRQAERASVLRLTTGFDEWQALNDPTLFARPHANGFGGAAWMRRQGFSIPVFRWTEPPRLLALDAGRLGEFFLDQIQSKSASEFQSVKLPLPEFFIPAPSPIMRPSPETSAVRASELSKRRLQYSPGLPPRPAADLLTNSVVQVLADSDGRVISAKLLPQSGAPVSTDQRAADLDALRLAPTVRFTPLVEKDAHPGVEMLIFEWQTTLSTNAPTNL